MTTFKADVTIEGDAAAGTMKIGIVQDVGNPDPNPEPQPPNPGDDWEPPNWLRYDTEVETVPEMSQPGYLETFEDEIFATDITRITGDPGTPIAFKDGSEGTWGDVAGHHYSSDQAWNCDQTMLFLDKNNGSGAYALMLDGESYEPLFPVSGLPSDVRWHTSDPALMMYVADSEIGTFDPKTGERQVLTDFGSQYTDLTFGGYEGSFTEDGDMVVVSCMYSGQYTGFTYKVSTGEKGKNIWASEIADGTCDNIRISSNGNYMLWGFDPDIVYVTDLAGTLITVLEEDWISHFDVITDQDGVECVCGRVNGDVGQGPSGRIAKYTLFNGERTELSQGGWSYHTSCRALKRRRWAVSGAGDEDGKYPPYNGEILMMELDGSKTYRCGHSHVPKSVDYKAETQASHSPDGSRIIFRGAWANGDDQPTRPVADYVIDMRG